MKMKATLFFTIIVLHKNHLIAVYVIIMSNQNQIVWNPVF